ncbi:hypothetical protein [Methylosinus sp. LW4]|uniref:hypothetical protein n=1 Tax=Methylosinus sp. LW4 TaxID=136993 RepID=UPI0003644A3D|nr:hypothetical protein [Methylosinus sp. LW4]
MSTISAAAASAGSLDVRAIQRALNAKGATIAEDGALGPATRAAIYAAVQAALGGVAAPWSAERLLIAYEQIMLRDAGLYRGAIDGRAGAATRDALAKWSATQTRQITIVHGASTAARAFVGAIDWDAAIYAVCPRAKASIVDMVALHADEQFARWRLTTPSRQATILAHISVETSGFTTLEESMDYRAQRIVEVWPTRFKSVYEAMPFAHNPKALANKVYNGRLGNRVGTDDGWNFRGHGMLQSTGREKGEMLAKELGVSAEAVPDMLVAPDSALECACALFVLLNAVGPADSGDVALQTRRIQGGDEGLAARAAARQRFLAILQAPEKRAA